jgi:hypothetical protein
MDDLLWCLLDQGGDRSAGDLYARDPGVCLFARAADAERVRQELPAPERWAVRGVGRPFLRLLLTLADRGGLEAPLVLVAPGSDAAGLTGWKVAPREVRAYALKGDLPRRRVNVRMSARATSRRYQEVRPTPQSEATASVAGRAAGVLDGYLAHIQAVSRLGQRNAPALAELLEHYRRQLATASPEPLHTGQEYARNVSVPGAEYRVAWSIPAAHEVIRRHRVPIRAVPIADLLPAVDRSLIESQRLGAAANNPVPVVVARYRPSPGGVVLLDGHHRVLGKHMAGRTLLNAYVLEPRQQVEALVSPLDRAVCSVHHNITELQLYLEGHKEWEGLTLLPV